MTTLHRLFHHSVRLTIVSVISSLIFCFTFRSLDFVPASLLAVCVASVLLFSTIFFLGRTAEVASFIVQVVLIVSPIVFVSGLSRSSEGTPYLIEWLKLYLVAIVPPVVVHAILRGMQLAKSFLVQGNK